jgi:hypothetical protein
MMSFREARGCIFGFLSQFSVEVTWRCKFGRVDLEFFFWAEQGALFSSVSQLIYLLVIFIATFQVLKGAQVMMNVETISQTLKSLRMKRRPEWAL